MNGAVAFSLFGRDPQEIYYGGAIKNAEMYAKLRPEWRCIFYLGKSVPAKIAAMIEDVGNSTILRKRDFEDQRSTFWRFLAVKDTWHDFYVFRDVDGRPGPRELAAVDDWLDSPYDFHVMRDHPRHNVPMLAGMWGVKGKGVHDLRQVLPDALKTDYYQVDQDYLRNQVWPLAQQRCLAHVGWNYYWGEPESRIFPVERDEFDFVAEGKYGDDRLRFPDHRIEVAVPGYRADT